MAEQMYGQPLVGWWRRLRPYLTWRWLRACLTRLGLFLPYFYLLRVTLLTGLFLFCIPWLAFYLAPQLLANLFDLDASRIFCVTAAALMATWSLLISARVTLINGYERFDVPLYLKPADRPEKDYQDVGADLRRTKPGLITLLLCTLPAFPVIVAAVLGSSSPIWYTGLAVIAGVVVATALFWIAHRLFYALLPSAMRDTLPRLPGLESLASVAQASATSASAARPARRFLRLRRWFQWLLNHVPQSLGKGYLNYPETGPVSIYPGHLLALAMLIVSVGFYIWFGIWKLLNLGVPIVVPTLAYALVLVTMLSWIFAGMTFFFDRYRIPVLVLLLLGGIATTQFSGSDYYYKVLPQAPGTTAAEPYSVIQATDQSSVIVVAANGGGIQSAAWTARVLTGLEAQARKDFGSEFRGFGKSIRLISAVSGGSVGTMHVVNAYTRDGLPADAELERIVEQAERSSLDDVAWGLAYPDMLRLVLPFNLLSTDRGQALEAAWNRDNSLGIPLSQWRKDVKEGWRPATIFNATIADTGERLLFSTSGLGHNPLHGRLFEQEYRGLDVSVVTAARLSATFPFVTPAAVAETSGEDQPQFHVVDGGYYDNYGMATLTEWLDQALNGSRGSIKNVLVLQIRGAPGGTDPIYRFDGDDPCPKKTQALLTKDTPRGWFYQLYAPFSSLLHVRDTGQIAHNDVEFKLLQQLWEQRGVQIKSVVFQYQGGNTPLSWHLTDQQKQDIERYWAAQLADCPEGPKEINMHSWNTVKQFLEDIN